MLNANGWAINSNVIVNIPFGRTLTSIAKYPKLKLDDPYKPKTPLWRKILCWFICLAIVAFGVLFFTGNLKCIGLPFPKEKPAEELVEGAEGAPVSEDVATEVEAAE